MTERGPLCSGMHYAGGPAGLTRPTSIPLRQCVNCQVNIDEYAPDLILCGACEDELFGEAG